MNRKVEVVFKKIVILAIMLYFVMKRVVEVAIVAVAVVAWLFVDEYPTYGVATVSLEHWPTVLLSGLVIMLLMGFVQYKMNKNGRKHARYNDNALYFMAGVCTMAFGKALIDDIGDALVYYLDSATSPVFSGWVALIVVVMIACVYGCWICHKAKNASRRRQRQLKTTAV